MFKLLIFLKVESIKIDVIKIFIVLFHVKHMDFRKLDCKWMVYKYVLYLNTSNTDILRKNFLMIICSIKKVT